ncbi:hypothetical protein CPB85DRAFT_1288893, partial [Mucidula mucida]
HGGNAKTIYSLVQGSIFGYFLAVSLCSRGINMGRRVAPEGRMDGWQDRRSGSQPVGLKLFQRNRVHAA